VAAIAFTTMAMMDIAHQAKQKKVIAKPLQLLISTYFCWLIALANQYELNERF